MKKSFLVTAVFALLCLSGIAQANITIETVAVGNKGNAADTRVMTTDGTTGYGAVDYDYNIGKYEVTSGQYTAFLNAKAATDPYGLYNSYMTLTSQCGISRRGASGSYTYNVVSAWANKPVNFINFWDCCRFANWLSNGQGTGDTETGAYTLTTSGIANNTITRNTGAKWAVTSENEWYKAAYYSIGGAYSLYANGTSIAPGMETDSNYGGTVGTYSTIWDGYIKGTLEQNGTKNMMGNVREWNDSIIRGTNRGVRGGDFIYLSDHLQASSRFSSTPMVNEGTNQGFRVVSLEPVPEPSSFIAGAALLTPLLVLRRRSRK